MSDRGDPPKKEPAMLNRLRRAAARLAAAASATHDVYLSRSLAVSLAAAAERSVTAERGDLRDQAWYDAALLTWECEDYLAVLA